MPYLQYYASSVATMQGEDRAVKQFQFNGWPDYKSVPSGTSGLLRLTDAVQEWTRQNGKGPITVHCMYVSC